MGLRDARGANKVQARAENKERVAAYIERNPTATKGEACKDLGMTYKTLARHLKELKLA